MAADHAQALSAPMVGQVVRRGRRWILALVLSSVLLCAALVAAHVVQARRVAAGTAQVLALKQASADLDEAFLHLQLGGEPDSPWQRPQGLALLAQAERALLDVGSASGQAQPAREVAAAIATLRGAWGSDRLSGVQARLALHELRRELSALDDAVRRHADEAASRLDALFNATIALAVLTLAAVIAGLARSERNRAQVQAELQRRDERLRSTLQSLSEGVMRFDAKGRVLDCNPAAELLLGRTLAQMQALPARSAEWGIEQADGRPLAHEASPLRQALLSGQPQHGRVLAINVPGRGRRELSVNVQPLRDGAAGLVGGVVLSFTDVTEERATEAQLAAHRERLEELVQARTRELQNALQAQREVETFARTITDNQPTLLAYWDSQLRLRFANRAYLEWFGLQRESVIGRPIDEVLGVHLSSPLSRDIERVLSGETFESTLELSGANGRFGHFWTYRLPDCRGQQVAGYFLIATDVTALKQAEAQLAQLNTELSRRAEQAESATRAKSAFLANMSHEIRTPMNAIIGLTHLMSRDSRDPRQLERLAKVEGAAKHLLQVINDILDLSKIEAGKLELADAPFGRDELVSRALAMVSESAREKGLQLINDTAALPERLRGDAKNLAQALINLLVNAVKFTDSGYVRLRGLVAEETAERLLLRFEVQDSGIGVPPERQDALFHAFEQVDNSMTRRHGGTGLGLTLTRHLATLMGGEAGMRSEPGVGSTFWFTAWVARVAAAQEGAARAWPEAPPPAATSSELAALLRSRHAGRRVLLAEDNPINQEVASELLTSAGLHVEVAGDGAQAVERAMVGRHDLVLMDVQMPLMDGMTATREIRRRMGPALPIVAMTANAFAEDRAACLEAGMNDHLGKPVEPQRLFAALLHWLPAPGAGAAPDRRAADTPAPAQDPLAEVEGFNLERALRNVGGRRATLERVLRAFAANYGQGEPALLQPPVGDTLAQLRQACHSLRGACGAVGAVDLVDELQALEAGLADAAQAAGAGEAARRCDDQLRRFVQRVTAALQGPAGLS